MEYGTKLVLLKYGKTPHDCMERHIDKINKEGYCWFGKIGVAPSISVIRDKIGEETFSLLLYCQGEAYICKCTDVKNEKPDNGIPSYYDTHLYGKGIYPKIYFKLISIDKLEAETLSKMVILSSRNELLSTVKSSMASFFYVEYPDPNKEGVLRKNLEKKKSEKQNGKSIEPKKKKITNVSSNDCVYRIDGYCANKRCVSYEFECTRPSDCMKQKCN